MGISVLISVYHKEDPKYLNQALESIWDNQTLKPKEIVLVEDGKLTNDLYNVLDYWKTKLGSALNNIPLTDNVGLTKALNIGIEYCKGDYIARMDSDDICTPTRFENQVNYLQKNEDLSVIGGSIQEFYGNVSNLSPYIRTYPQSPERAKSVIHRVCPLAHPAVMFRKKVFDDGFRYNEKHKTSQDIELWFRLLRGGYEISNIPDVVLYFRINDDFINRRSKKKAFNEFEFFFKGILSLYGISWRLIFPISRLCLRLMPTKFIELFYSSKLRRLIHK